MEIKCAGDHIKGSPFLCHCFDPNSVQVYGLDVGLVGQELRFTIDACKAGDGEIKVSTDLEINHQTSQFSCLFVEKDIPYP